ncbi:MAG TPA: ATP-binding protein, partial [Candidatus Kapabacteria bacterium]|nr:ATP-binding protein [Candidatus Kapabacteria bacterium]
DLNKKFYFEVEANSRALGISHSIIENIYSFDKVYVFIITDLTEKREIEKKLQQKERLALIGEMSAGIAHEIRNPLASISGSVQFLSKELKLDTEYQNLMDIIVKESGRLSNSIEVFLDYARPIPLIQVEFDLSQAVDDVVELISLNYPGIKVVKKYSEGNFILADMKKIDQVIWNLINNSVKAITEGGIIEINIYSRDDDIYLSIKDNGIGIARGEMEKMFTPFYSKFSSGIGLGMAIVKRIIDEHNFDIKIISEKNIGTEVIICFKGN